MSDSAGKAVLFRPCHAEASREGGSCRAEASREGGSPALWDLVLPCPADLFVEACRAKSEALREGGSPAKAGSEPNDASPACALALRRGKQDAMLGGIR